MHASSNERYEAMIRETCSQHDFQITRVIIITIIIITLRQDCELNRNLPSG